MRLPRHSTVVSYLALVFSLGTGGAVAATQLASNSVGSPQIKPHSIQTSDISPSALADMRGSRRAVRAAGTVGVVVRKGTSTPIAPGHNGAVQAVCAAGEQVVGGGAGMNTTDGDQFSGVVRASYPTNHPVGWLTLVYNQHPTMSGIVTGYAVCLAG